MSGEQMERKWLEKYMAPLATIAALPLTLYIIGEGPKLIDNLREAWPTVLFIGYGATRFLLRAFGLFIGLYVVVRFIKWAWRREP